MTPPAASASPRMLLVVDPQNDFIDGALPVAGAAEAMDALARHIRDSDGAWACKAVTLDWHPYDHSSFAERGGPWPRHCVRHTSGSAIRESLVAPLFETAGETRILTKGVHTDVEEYSIFKNATSAAAIDDLVRAHAIEGIDLCGIAGDVCVLATLRDGAALYGPGFFRVLAPFSPSLDGGAALAAAIEAL